MTNNAPSLYDLLPEHPDNIYPSWKPTRLALDRYEDSISEPQLLSCGYNYQPNGGIMSRSYPHDYVPDEAEEFMRGQYSINEANPTQTLIYYCWWEAFTFVEQIDPYSFFYGCCDVIKTEESYHYQYAVCDDSFQNWTEVDPGATETFIYWEEGVQAWNIMMNYPGLDSYFDLFFDYFNDTYQEALDSWENDLAHPMIEFIHIWGRRDAYHMIHLGLWSAIMWMMSPMARPWRAARHPIFDTCYEYGSCLIHDWCFYPPPYYRKENRPALTCAVCGVSEWCVELVQMVDGETRFLCEHCLNPVPHAYHTCGTRSCTNIKCEHHPGINAAKRIAADKRFGSLRQLPDGRKARALPGMMTINQTLIDQYASSIADVVGQDLKRLLTF